MLDEENLKKNTGKLGLYMIEDAQQEIKNIQRKILFQKAEIRKDYEERTLRSSQKIREDFKIRFNEILNKSFLDLFIDGEIAAIKFIICLIGKRPQQDATVCVKSYTAADIPVICDEFHHGAHLGFRGGKRSGTFLLMFRSPVSGKVAVKIQAFLDML